MINYEMYDCVIVGIGNCFFQCEGSWMVNKLTIKYFLIFQLMIWLDIKNHVVKKNFASFLKRAL